jgi:hypothetical protein
MRKLFRLLVAILLLFTDYPDCFAQSAQDMANAKAWYNNFTRYYNNNKRNFDTFLSHIKSNKAKFRTEELDTYKQNVTVLNEQYNANIIPFNKLLKDKQINPGTVQRS